MSNFMNIFNPVAELLSKTADKIWVDKDKKLQFQKDILELGQAMDVKELESRFEMIKIEAQSEDKFVKRARPAFLWFFYLLLLMVVLVYPVIGYFNQDFMDHVYSNIKAGFDAIPEELWAVFTIGFLGYGGYRTYEKVKGRVK